MLNLNLNRFTLSLALCGLLAACSTAPKIAGYQVNQIEAEGQNSRVRHIVLHYTAIDTPTSLKILTQKNVSSHYLITDEQPPKLYQLVPETNRAWHAGLSNWQNYSDLNTSSIGIEIVNAGRKEDGSWQPYSADQIAMVKALVRDIAERHQVAPVNIVGHSDIAPQRKIDPGPLFPWAELAAEGLGRWYNPTDVYNQHAMLELSDMPSYSEIQQLLKSAGYTVPLHGQWDTESQKVMAAFQMHYRPARYDGIPDTESIAILKALPK